MYNNWTDNQLRDEFKRGNGYKKDKIGDELKRRGYEQVSHSEWTGGESIAGSIISNGIGALWLIVGFFCLLVAITYIMPKSEILIVLQKGPEFIANEISPYLPLDQAYTKLNIQVKLVLMAFSVGIAFGLPASLTPLWFLFRRKIRYSTIFKIQFLFLMASSVYFCYFVKENDAQTIAYISFGATFIVSLLILIMLRRIWAVGLSITVISLLGFIVAGNSLLYPFLLLIAAGISIMFVPGVFINKRKAKGLQETELAS